MNDETGIVEELRAYEKSGKMKKINESTTQRNFQILKSSNNNIKDKLEKKDSDNSLNEKNHLENYYKELYKKLIQNSLEGILILDFKGKILFANPAIAKIFGFKNTEETIGKNALDFIDSKYRKKLIKDQNLVRMGKEGFLNIYKAVTTSREKIWIEGIGYKIKHLGKTANVIFIRDITKRQKTSGELVKLGDKYKALTEMSSDGIITIDIYGKLTYVNPSFEKMCEKNQDELIGTLFRDFLSEGSVYLFQEIFIDARKNNKKIRNVELELSNRNEGHIPIEVSLAPLRNDYNEFIGMACTVHDITEHKRIEEELKKSEKLKTEFMNIAAHELKSPVTPIKGYLDLIISDENVNERTKKWGMIGLRNTEKLLELVNDILDVSRLDSDTMTFNMEKINLVNIIEEVVEDMKPAVEAKNLTFNTFISKKLPYIYGDRYRLEQVLKNLLTNAIKFTNQGSITINTKIEDSYLLISIEDTGIGIAEGKLKKIFTKFYQAYTSNNRKSEGTGLGLFICNEIIKRHNGKIWAESKISKGSKFIIRIPSIQY
jgi:PAS domain S-box-containing protein